MVDTMLIHPHIADYISSLEPELPEELDQLECSARAAEVPIIRKEAQGLLRFLLTVKKPKAILEIGTAVGFSACFMNDCCNKKADITTIEKVPARIEAAERNFQSLSCGEGIRLLKGDAKEILEKLSDNGEQYDFIFLDAAKAQYPVYLTYICKLITPGGILVTDNILQEGSIAESKFTITRRDRTIHLRMREYVDALFHTEGMTSVLLPVGDGMTVTTFQA